MLWYSREGLSRDPIDGMPKRYMCQRDYPLVRYTYWVSHLNER